MENGRLCLNCQPGRHDRCQNFILPEVQEPRDSETRGLPSSLPPTLPSHSAKATDENDQEDDKDVDSGNLVLTSSNKLFPTCSRSSFEFHCRPSSPNSTTLPSTSSEGRLAGEHAGEHEHMHLQVNVPGALSGLDATTCSEHDSPVAETAADGSDCTSRDLPPFSPVIKPDFQWGNLTGEDFSHVVRSAYSEIVHWRRNVFMVPSGKVGKEFVRELTNLFSAYAHASALEGIAFEAAMVACSLLPQKPYPTSKCSDHISALECRIKA